MKALEDQLVRSRLPQVKVTILTTSDCGSENLDAALAILSEEELERFRKFLFEQDRKDYALAHALLRHTLSKLAPETDRSSWRITTPVFGKPRVIGRPDLDFSLTHTRGLVACVVTNTALVGIDAETNQRSLEMDLLMREVCSNGERRELARLTGSDRTSRFLDFWTLKEAVLKACGLGIASELSAVDVTITDDSNIEVQVPQDLCREDSSYRIYRIRGLARVALAIFGILDVQEIEAKRVGKWDA